MSELWKRLNLGEAYLVDGASEIKITPFHHPGQAELDKWEASKWLYQSFEIPWYRRIFRRKPKTNPLATWRPLGEILTEAKRFGPVDDTR